MKKNALRRKRSWYRLDRKLKILLSKAAIRKWKATSARQTTRETLFNFHLI